MKHQYFGDIHDFRKYGLLRVLQQHGDLQLLVAWMLTADDGGGDGRKRRYLEQPERWWAHDPELFDGIQDLLRLEGAPPPLCQIARVFCCLQNVGDGMKSFTKSATTVAEQMALLKARGLIIRDEARTEHFLEALTSSPA